ncbi:hypothetical protein TSAR_009690 [Trichomalopsis sarcophagae]|uniref:Uncharacterized protein n=1 Tax=Trichomalopsis sarcophagae TaxID=543379 RepID=A0A232EI67_9HYME|nr:hypothetical protein TSAR_009690 [Trichomalopsis sarcophagae]
MEFERRLDESIRRVIQKVRTFRHEYKRRSNLPEHDKGRKAIAELCVYHFEPFVCEGLGIA